MQLAPTKNLSGTRAVSGRAGRSRVGAAFAALAVVALVSSLLSAGLGMGDPAAVFFTVWLDTGVILASALACLWRAVRVREERAAWLLMAAGVALWCGGSSLFSALLRPDGSIPIPSAADALWLPAYPVMCGAFLLIVRSRLTASDRALWLDGAIAALTLAAVASSVALQTIMDATAGSLAVVATGLAYVVMDVVLLMLVTLVFGLLGWRPGRAWLAAGAGLLMLGTADLIWLFQTAEGAYAAGGMLDVMWPAAFVLIAVAAWQPVERREGSGMGMLSAAAPALAAMTAGVLLLYDHFARISTLANTLAAAAVGLACTRLFLAFLQNQRLLESSRREALKDSLTGLSNRRLLMRDLEHAVGQARLDTPLVVLLLDLNGFKAYNDTFGHPAGDRLLMRLASRFEKAVAPHGSAYRLGGDEFCALVPHSAIEIETLEGRVAAALSEAGEGFSIDSSQGLALVPAEAADVEEALALADRRLYSEKGANRASASHQTRNVLMTALYERGPDLHSHVEEVAELAIRVASRMGMCPRDVDDVARAAELHDVGKVAIPDAILNKPSALDDDEWAFMKRHTIIGERILAAAPALASVARIVRSSHERFDGTGYPDRLAGAAIPLGARVVFACDAFDAMTSDRPYRSAMPREDAVEELRRGAGSQFDPEVVEALCAAVDARATADDPLADAPRVAHSRT